MTTVQPIKAQIALQTLQLKNTLDNLSEQAANTVARPDLNPIKWVVGHLLNTRLLLLKLLNGKAQDPLYLRLFGKGSSAVITDEFPSLEAILEKWDQVAVELSDAFEQASPEQLASKAPFQTSIPDDTLLGLFAYLAAHEAHHIGQLSILRKLV